MKDNTVNVQDVDIYLDNINIYADEYINTVLCISPDNENYKKEVSDSFVDMIFYIADHIQKPSNDNIELLDKMFNTYVRLCSKYHRCHFNCYRNFLDHKSHFKQRRHLDFWFKI